MKKILSLLLILGVGLWGCPGKAPITPTDTSSATPTAIFTAVPTTTSTPIPTSYIQAAWTISGCSQLVLFLTKGGIQQQASVTLITGSGNQTLWSNLSYGSYIVNAQGFGTYLDVYVAGPVNMAVTLSTTGTCIAANEHLNFN